MVNNVVNGVDRLLKDRISKIEKVVSTISKNHVENEKLRKEYGLEDNMGFNIFTSISNQYYKENFHSDILADILDQNSGLSGDKYIEIFLQLIDQKKYFPQGEEIFVERESSNIDILIFNESHAIIIENKINNAIDQPNQLARYIKKVNEKNLTVCAIIYLTLIPGKRPLLDYSTEFEKYIPEVNKKIICLSAVEGVGKKDLVHCFLNDCINGSNDELSRVYIDQYRRLLMHLGGEAVMKENDKRVIEEIFSGVEKIGTVKDLVEVWNEKESLIGEIILDYIKEKDSKFSVHPYGDTIHKKLDEDISLAYNTDGSFGFVYAPDKGKIASERIEGLKKILDDDVAFSSYSGEVSFDDEWVYRQIKLDEYMDELKTIKELTYKRLMEIERRYNAIHSC